MSNNSVSIHLSLYNDYGTTKMKQQFLLSCFLFVLITTVPSSNCLGSQSYNEGGFFQHIFYEIMGSNTDLDNNNKTEEAKNEVVDIVTGNEIGNRNSEIGNDRKSKVVSPTLVDVPPPYKEYARMARYVVHNSGQLKVI